MPSFDFTSPAFIASLVVSVVGMVLFMYGKRASRQPELMAGIALMVVPYFVHGVLLLSGITGVVVAALWFITHGKF